MILNDKNNRRILIIVQQLLLLLIITILLSSSSTIVLVDSFSIHHRHHISRKRSGVVSNSNNNRLAAAVIKTNNNYYKQIRSTTTPENETNEYNNNNDNSRRNILRSFLFKTTAAAMTITTTASAYAETAAAPPTQNQQISVEELDKLYDDDDATKPDIPSAPEERSGLVVLRVAEVAQFQEKILRAIVKGDLPPDVKVAPMQFSFGTTILLKNSNLDSNMKMMINDEIPRRSRNLAIKNAVSAMNELVAIRTYAASIERDFEPNEMIELADMYLKVRVDLNSLYEYLPEKDRKKYDGYFVAVTEYEKKIAEGTYNPDIDGALKFD
mmetsp:Transcript_19969/g.22845  ORF Transcript_19969/g.22845 Transcript_19969/m.22845 type:complete len:326 (-) Transcript_19969:19-996(-)